MNTTVIDLGFISIKWYSILILVSLLIGIKILEREASRFNLNKDFLYNLIFGVVISGIISARIYYVIFNMDYYSKNLLDIFKIWEGGLAIHGAILGGVIYTTYYTKKYKLNTMHIIDLFIPALILGQIIGRWGNFFNKEAHGQATSLEFLNNLHLPKFIIDGMNINGIYYQPTFLYESLWNLIGLIIIIFIIKKLKNIKVGDITGFYLIWYSIVRFFIESLRTDSLMLFDIKVAKLVSIILFIFGVIIIFRNRINKNSKYYNKQDYKKFRYGSDKNV